MTMSSRADNRTLTYGEAVFEATRSEMARDPSVFVMGQGVDVLGPLAKCGNAQIDHVQPIEQILAERAVLDRFGQVAVGGGDDADIDLDRLGAADAIDLAFLDGAQQLGL